MRCHPSLHYAIFFITARSACSFSGGNYSTHSHRLETASHISPEPQQASPGKTFSKGAWKPPSQNKVQRKGKVFSIQQPQDLLDFVVEDERLSVVKVFASWCKTCQVFDVRYRKLANQYSEKSDSGGIAKHGRVRFAEMQYDNPNNEEMCQLLNATKLPYILMYKGSKGKLDEFQCGPGTFQVLIDKVREYADSEEEIAYAFQGQDTPAATNGADNSHQEQPSETIERDPVERLQPTAATAMSSNKQYFGTEEPTIQPKPPQLAIQVESEDIENLKQQLAKANNEKNELFEIMKADLDWHKDQIQQLNEAIKSQREQYESLLRSRDGELTKVEQKLAEEQKWFDREVVSLTDQLNQISSDLQQSEQAIQSLQSEVSLWKQRAESTAYNEMQTRQLVDRIDVYESERNSLRKLTVLAVKRVWRGAGSVINRLRDR